MSAEHQEMLARISEIAGRINRHKNQQAGLVPTARHGHNAAYGSSRHQNGGQHHRGGFRVGKPTPHRHRTLILNGSTPSSKASDADSGAASDASSSSWVTRTDRHLQLINSSVYEKDAQARTKAIEQTRRQKMQHRDDTERAQLVRHLTQVARAGGVAANTNPAARYEIVVEGIRFHVTKSGSKLVKVPGDPHAPGETPKMAIVGGVKFYRSKSGNLYRHGVVKAQRQTGTVKKIAQPCKIFSTTGISLLQPRTSASTSMLRLSHGKSSTDKINLRLGSCPKGPQCRYMHDPSKVSACKEFLQKGECVDGDTCDLSHDLTPERTPHCLHFAKGNCTNPNCRYTHVTVSPGALVCRSFGTYGYCEKGAECPDRHVYECPDFSNTGVCKTKGCKLLHRERASVLRRANQARDAGAEETMVDVSSDDDGDSADSDDVDSDAVDEFVGADDAPDLDFATQKDFIEL